MTNPENPVSQNKEGVNRSKAVDEALAHLSEMGIPLQSEPQLFSTEEGHAKCIGEMGFRH
jgi:hypothetical protein